MADEMTTDSESEPTLVADDEMEDADELDDMDDEDADGETDAPSVIVCAEDAPDEDEDDEDGETVVITASAPPAEPAERMDAERRSPPLRIVRQASPAPGGSVLGGMKRFWRQNGHWVALGLGAALVYMVAIQLDTEKEREAWLEQFVPGQDGVRLT